ncbi:unnamed protein product, partial [Symbiodinium sp. KB8]
VQHSFDEDDLKDIVSSASDSSVHDSMSSGGGGDNGSDVSRLSLPGHMLDELATPQLGRRSTTKISTPPSTGILKTPTFGSEIKAGGTGAALRRLVERLQEENARLHEQLVEVQTTSDAHSYEQTAKTTQLVLALRGALAQQDASKSHARCQQLEADVARMSQQLQLSREPFTRPLAVSAAMAQELKMMPSERLSLCEFIQLRLFEEMQPLREALDAARRERDSAQSSLTDKIETSEAAQRAVLHRAHLAEGHLEASKQQVAVLEAAQERLQARLGTALEQVEELTRKGQEYDALLVRFNEGQAQRQAD